VSQGNAWFESAVEHHRAGRLEQALAGYREALRAEPAHGEALTGLCQVLEALGRSDEAVPFLDGALGLRVEPEGHSQFDAACRSFQLGQVDEALALFRQATAGVYLEPAQASIATIIPGSSESDNRAILEARRAWAELYVPAARRSGFERRIESADEPVRVGYVSSFFPKHNWMKPVWGLINHHDRGHFQINLFSDAPADQIKHGYRPCPEDRFHDISGLANRAVAERIEAAGIDLLVDLNGYSRTRRLPLFGLRPAPVVVEWFNMYATSGISSIDYLIGDDVVIPQEEEEYYCEKIIRVAGSYLTFEVGYPVPKVAMPPCSTMERFTFGCLAPLYKITRNVVDAWSRILHDAPDTVLRLRNSALGAPEAVEHVHALFRDRDIPPERLCLDGPAEHYDFLRTYDHIDVALDTFPYSGGTTTAEAIWQGVPVVTFSGDRWIARTSASILRAANLGEFVGRSLGEYISIAVRIANSPCRCEFLEELRQNMRSRLGRSPVCDTAGFARNMERIYRQMVGLSPQ
jgi:predicted O-linked N-acetylglucosamine transferase (SPINDLY family)